MKNSELKSFKWTPPKIDEPPLTGREKVGHFLFGFSIVIILLAIWLFFSWFDYWVLEKLASVGSNVIGGNREGIPLSFMLIGLPLFGLVMHKTRNKYSVGFPEGTFFQVIVNLFIGKNFLRERNKYRVYGFRVFLLTAAIAYYLYVNKIIEL